MSIDARIAELKGEKIYPMREQEPDKFLYNPSEDILGKIPLARSKKIHLAMELWDQMAKAELSTALSYDGDDADFVIWDKEDHILLQVLGEDTRCLAICNAWLEWKNGLD